MVNTRSCISAASIARVTVHSCAGGREESTWDALVMLGSSPALAGVNAGFMACVLGANVLGLLVTCRLGSVSRAALLFARTALVSQVQLAL